MPVLHRWEDDGQHFLLIRRSIDDPKQKAYYFVFAPPGTTLQEMVKAIGKRWHIEEDFENGKDMGLDQYEVRSFVGWYRHVTLVMLAQACLAGICARDRDPPTNTPKLASLLEVAPLTIPEVGHLLATLIWPMSTNARLVLNWSWWRRCHRGMASRSHAKRRLKAG